MLDLEANGKVRILVADDHAAMRKSFRYILSQNSRWEVCGEAENGRDAIAKVRELKPDLIVLDVTMPIMNGFEAARELRRIAPETKIVLVSMHDSDQFKVEALRAGADAFVSKNVGPDRLIDAVGRLINSLGVKPIASERSA